MAVTKLDPRKEKAALLIAEGWKQVDVAREMGVYPQTVSRWMKEEDFTARIDELRVDLTSQAVTLLRESVVENTEIVLKIAKQGGEPGVVSSQLKAALWAIDKVLGKSAEETATRSTRAVKSVESTLLKQPEEELQELLDRGK